MSTQPKTPVKSEARPVQAPHSSDADVDAFLAHLNTLAPLSADGRGRLIFAMDATMSRQPTWDLALGLQADMFRPSKRSADWMCSWSISAVSTKPAPANGSTIRKRLRDL